MKYYKMKSYNYPSIRTRIVECLKATLSPSQPLAQVIDDLQLDRSVYLLAGGVQLNHNSKKGSVGKGVCGGGRTPYLQNFDRA